MLLFFPPRELQIKRQRTLSFQEQCDELMSVQKSLEEKLTSGKTQSYSSVQQMLSVHQVLKHLQFETDFLKLIMTIMVINLSISCLLSDCRVVSQ